MTAPDILFAAACGVAGVCIAMLGFAIKRHLETNDARDKVLDGHGRELVQLQSAMDHVQADQKAHAEHATQLSEVRVKVGVLEERSIYSAKMMNYLARQNQVILQRLPAPGQPLPN